MSGRYLLPASDSGLVLMSDIESALSARLKTRPVQEANLAITHQSCEGYLLNHPVKPEKSRLSH